MFWNKNAVKSHCNTSSIENAVRSQKICNNLIFAVQNRCKITPISLLYCYNNIADQLQFQNFTNLLL